MASLIKRVYSSKEEENTTTESDLDHDHNIKRAVVSELIRCASKCLPLRYGDVLKTLHELCDNQPVDGIKEAASILSPPIEFSNDC